MNLIGKIFTVLIFVMSIVFMTMAIMVYATHKNWRDVVHRAQYGLEGPTRHGRKAKTTNSNRKRKSSKRT